MARANLIISLRELGLGRSMRRLALASLAASLVGLVDAAYVQSTLYGGPGDALLCTPGGLLDCYRVVNSGFSHVLGIPLSALAMAWFSVSASLALAMAVGLGKALLKPLLAWSLIGASTVPYFIYLEIFVIGALCTHCTIMHIAILTIFSLTYLAYARYLAK